MNYGKTRSFAEGPCKCALPGSGHTGDYDAIANMSAHAGRVTGHRVGGGGDVLCEEHDGAPPLVLVDLSLCSDPSVVALTPTLLELFAGAAAAHHFFEVEAGGTFAAEHVFDA